MVIEIEAEEVTLRLVRRAKAWAARKFEAQIVSTGGKRYVVHLDGLQLGDLVEDAADAGMPTAEEIRRQKQEKLPPPHPGAASISSMRLPRKKRRSLGE